MSLQAGASKLALQREDKRGENYIMDTNYQLVK